MSKTFPGAPQALSPDVLVSAIRLDSLTVPTLLISAES